MTEQEWLSCSNVSSMLAQLPGLRVDRKLRLFACSCFRNVWSYLDDLARSATVLAERVADGEASQQEVMDILRQYDLYSAEPTAVLSQGRIVLHENAAFAASAAARVAQDVLFFQHACLEPDGNALTEADCLMLTASEQAKQCALLRDIICYPSRSMCFADEWRTSAVLAIAYHIYKLQDYSAMPILADALEDAGCNSTELITHCRSDIIHTKGCYLIDLICRYEQSVLERQADIGQAQSTRPTDHVIDG